MQNQTNKSTTKYYILGIVTGILAAVAITLGIAGIVRFIHVLVPLSQGNAMAGSHITDGNVEKKLALLEDTIQKYFWKDVEEEQLEDGLYRGLLR